jgi:hypothetical protein
MPRAASTTNDLVTIRNVAPCEIKRLQDQSRHGHRRIGRQWPRAIQNTFETSRRQGRGCGTDLEGAGGELDADGGLGLEAELVAGEAGEDVGLPDAGVADEDDLEEVVVLVVHPVRHRGSCATHAKIHPMRRGRAADRPDRIARDGGRIAGIARAYLGFDPTRGWGGSVGGRMTRRAGVGGAGELATTMREREETEQNERRRGRR